MSEPLYISPDELVPRSGEYMTHMSDEEEKEFHNSLSEEGIRQPLVVREEGKEVIDGNRRIDWALENGVKEVPFHPVEVSETTARKLALVLNFHRGAATDKTAVRFLDAITSEEGEELRNELAELIGEDLAKMVKLLFETTTPEEREELEEEAEEFDSVVEREDSIQIRYTGDNARTVEEWMEIVEEDKEKTTPQKALELMEAGAEALTS